jgi:exodeoxyribonuclease VII small subunit
MTSNLTYEQAYTELKQIAEDIDNENVSVDVLAEKVKRASELIEFCQRRLKSTEKEINQIIRGMEGEREGKS